MVIYFRMYLLLKFMVFFRKSFLISVAAISLLILSTATVSAHHGAETSVIGSRLSGPIITLPAYTLPEGKGFIGGGFTATRSNRFSLHRNTQLLRSRLHGHDNGHTFSPFLSAGYGLTDDLSLLVTLPYVYKFDIASTVNGTRLHQGNAVGLGDLTLMAQYRFLRDRGDKFDAALYAGVKMPTGETNEKDRFGEFIITDDQAGTGSWDPILGLAVSKEFDKFSLHASGMYKIATDGKRGVDAGDVLNYGLALTHRVGPESGFVNRVLPKRLLGHDLDWDLITEVNGQWAERVRINGVPDNSHGGNLVYFTKGSRVTVDDTWVVNWASSVLLLEGLNGFQSEPEMQLTLNVSRAF